MNDGTSLEVRHILRTIVIFVLFGGLCAAGYLAWMGGDLLALPWLGIFILVVGYMIVKAAVRQTFLLYGSMLRVESVTLFGVQSAQEYSLSEGTVIGVWPKSRNASTVLCLKRTDGRFQEIARDDQRKVGPWLRERGVAVEKYPGIHLIASVPRSDLPKEVRLLSL